MGKKVSLETLSILQNGRKHDGLYGLFDQYLVSFVTKKVLINVALLTA